MNRRQFSIASLSGIVLAATRTSQGNALDCVADCVSDRPAAVAVGSAYLKQHPENASRAVLLRHLNLPTGPLSAPQMAATIRRQIDSDFARQRTLVLNGWLISRSEAAICGLIALG